MNYALFIRLMEVPVQTIFEVTYKHIESLDPSQLTQLLGLLLHLEATTFGIPTSAITISQEIEVKDGGEDGRIEWLSSVESTNRLPVRLCMFQCKVTKDMSALDFANANIKKPLRAAEFAGSASNLSEIPVLKPRIAQVLDAMGAYIFFYSTALNGDQISERINSIRKMLVLCGRTDAHSANIQIYDANKITSWTNEHLPAIVQVFIWLNQNIHSGFQNWELWSYYTRKSFDFVEDDQSSKHINPLQSHLSVSKANARMLGLPGLGKSRLAFETLSAEHIRPNVVYIDCTLKRPELPDVLRRYALQGSRAIIVADNCDLELNKLLVDEVKRPESNLSLLTIDINPEESTSDSAPRIILQPMPSDTINKLLQQIFRAVLPSSDIEKVVSLAQGFPQIAYLIAEAHNEGVVNSTSLRDDLLFQRLVWGRENKNDEALEAISACSLFTRLGITGLAEDELLVVAKKFTSLTPERFYPLLQDFIKRGIVQQRGDYVRVVPRPLALRLAADWWQKCLPKRASDLVGDAEISDNLVASLCEQVKMLHYLPKVQELTKQLCGASGPFGQAEVLNTERGSLLFRSFVEVNPDETIFAITQAFHSWDRNRLNTIGPGRRNLVWALEKLCFWQSSFTLAARLLLRFAAAENESWANNATGQFKQLFQILLSGTQAPLADRASLLEGTLQSKCEHTTEVIISAAGRAFQIDHYSRTGGVEQQGSRPAQSDYQPRTGAEIEDYWQRCLKVLTYLATKHESEAIRQRAQRKISKVIYACVRKRVLNPLRDAIESVCTTRKGHFWSEALKNLDAAIRDDDGELTEEDNTVIARLYELLSPSSVGDRLKQWISDAGWDYLDRDSQGTIVDLSEGKTVELGEECAKTWPVWVDFLPNLLHGTQKNAFLFGQTLSAQSIQLNDIVRSIIDHLKTYPDGSANPILLSGILAHQQGKDDSFVREILDEFSKTTALHHYLILITSTIKPTPQDLQRALVPLQQKTDVPESYAQFSYGKVLDHHSSVDVCAFVEQIGFHGDAGAATALSIVHMYCYQSDERWSACKSTIRKIILSLNLAAAQAKLVHSLHMWKEDSLKLLQFNDEEVMNYLIDQIISVCESTDNRLFNKLDNSLYPIMRRLLSEEYREKAWTRLSPALISENRRLQRHMEWLLGHFVRNPEDGPDILSDLPEEFLFQWAKSDENAAVMLSRQIPPFKTVTESNDVTISEFLLKILDTFGSNKTVLSALSMNLWSYSGWGSLAPHYQQLVSFYGKLVDHSAAEVSLWAAQNKKAAESQLLEAQKREEEHSAGIIES